jgi:hypothetical protein
LSNLSGKKFITYNDEGSQAVKQNSFRRNEELGALRNWLSEEIPLDTFGLSKVDERFFFF